MPRGTPALCLFSEAIKVDYNDAGGFLQMIGFDGVELSVQPGGHIPLDGDIDLHLERAIEAMTGSGLDVPVAEHDDDVGAEQGTAHDHGLGQRDGRSDF